MSFKLSPQAMERLQTERKNWRKDHPKNFTAKPESKGGANDLSIWTCRIPGKEGTAWEGGEYGVRLDFPPNFPLEPPIATFTGTIFHPNVFGNGQVCLSILKANRDWAPGINIPQILLGLQDLLANPNPNDPANPQAAQLYQNNPRKYEETCRETAKKYKPVEVSADE